MLRRATPDDDDALLSWITSAQDLLLFTGPMLTWPLTLDQLHALEAIPGRHDHTLVSEADPGVALGHVEVSVVGEVARVSRVIIDPRWRGRGWARELVSLAVQDARTRGATSVGLHVIEGNQPALRTYLALGFTPDRSATAHQGVLALSLRLDRR